MCGIFGAIGCEVSDEALQRVLKMLHHRGPDTSGLFIDPQEEVTLAHTRLAIIDLIGGEQPLYSLDGNVVLIANGEIYDFERIRSSLEAKGHRFRTRSDSEVIIALYREHGLSCFEHLRGEFAFLLFDKTKRTLVAARDRLGIKPLYFARLSKGLVFASEMKAIFASGLVAPRLDARALDPFAEHQGRIPFQSIEEVPPGSFMSIDIDTYQPTLARYWSAEIPDSSAVPVAAPYGDAPSTAATRVLSELEQSVRLRLRADVPVGLYLSGGLDSAFIGALMSRNLKSSLHSFSISFVGSDRNEEAFAARAADFIGSTHHELAVTRDLLWNNLEDALWFSELPFGTLAPVGKFLLSREARKTVKVVLTGEGADEVFLGYRGFFQQAISETRRQHAGSKTRSAVLRRLGLGPFSARVLQRLSLLLFHKSQLPLLKSARRADARSTSSRPLINLMQEARIAAMPQDILCFLGDRAEMAHSLEARLPFLDHVLYELAKSVPADLKMRDGIEKAVLRDAARDVLPDDLRLRRKTGFMTTSEPVDMFGADREAIEGFRTYLSRQAFERSQLFSYAGFRMLALFARLPTSLRLFRRIRRGSNQLIMHMMQMHMLEKMYISDPRWKSAPQAAASNLQVDGA